MDELLKPRICHEQKQQQQREYKLIGRIQLKKGMNLYSLNMKSGELRQVEIETQVMVGLDGKPKKKNRAFDAPDLMYIPAINYKNAERKAKKFLTEMINKAKKDEQKTKAHREDPEGRRP